MKPYFIQKTLSTGVARDFIDGYLHKMNECSDENSSFYGSLGITNLKNSMFDLFIGGMDTTAVTLTWMLILMMKFPEIQKKVQEEIDEVIGNAEPSLNHRPVTPYVEATIHEAQRLSCIVPWGPRSTLEDVEVNLKLITFLSKVTTHCLCCYT